MEWHKHESGASVVDLTILYISEYFEDIKSSSKDIFVNCNTG
jgi:hypothetical protein